MEDVHFAVTDVETTGLFPGKDRIIEIAVVRIHGDGQIVDQYTTLVNPDRDLGATHIHGITASEIRDAPRFEQVAGDVALRLAGAIFVAHNAHFDFRFILSEFKRLGQTIPTVPMLCTMQVAGAAAPDLPGRNLEVCCAHFGISLSLAHRAQDDAHATASLLRECLARLRKRGVNSLLQLGIQGPPPNQTQWPRLPVTGKSLTRQFAGAAASLRPSYLSQLVAKLPLAPPIGVDLNPYFDLLDRVLENRRITADEANALYCLGADFGLSRQQVMHAHSQYLEDLVRAALADNIVTESERRDLEEVARLLSIPNGYLEELLSRSASPPAIQRRPMVALFDGESVCFTGTFRCRVHGEISTRDFAEEAARQRGMVVKKGVTRDLDFLVAADPDSLSGKAKKARDYGIRIIAEPVFWRMVGIDFE